MSSHLSSILTCLGMESGMFPSVLIKHIFNVTHSVFSGPLRNQSSAFLCCFSCLGGSAYCVHSLPHHFHWCSSYLMIWLQVIFLLCVLFVFSYSVIYWIVFFNCHIVSWLVFAFPWLTILFSTYHMSIFASVLEYGYNLFNISVIFFNFCI